MKTTLIESDMSKKIEVGDLCKVFCDADKKHYDIIKLTEIDSGSFSGILLYTTLIEHEDYIFKKVVYGDFDVDFRSYYNEYYDGKICFSNR